MKTIYAKCGVKNYMNEDHRSYRRNFSSCGKKAAKDSSSVGGCDGSSSISNTSGRNNKSSGGARALKVILKILKTQL